MFFSLVNLFVFCIVSISAIEISPTTECEKNNDEFCKLQQCKKYFAKNSERSKYIELSSPATVNLLLEFYVIGSSDCHVHLSPVDNPNQNNDVYHILICGFNNSRTFIRKGTQMLVDHNTPSVLSESEPVQIRIEKYQNGSIQIYHNNAPLVTAFDRRPAPTRYISFATDQPSGMSFFYDCLPHDSDTVNQKKVVSAQIFSVHSSVNRIVSQVYIIICTLAVLYIGSNT